MATGIFQAPSRHLPDTSRHGWRSGLVENGTQISAENQRMVGVIGVFGAEPGNPQAIVGQSSGNRQAAMSRTPRGPLRIQRVIDLGTQQSHNLAGRSLEERRLYHEGSITKAPSRRLYHEGSINRGSSTPWAKARRILHACMLLASIQP